MSHRLAQLHSYFASAVILRHGSDAHQIEQARSNLRSLATYCSNPLLAKAAEHHLDVCGFPTGNWQARFNPPNGVA